MRTSVALLLAALFVATPATAQLTDGERAWLDAHGPIRYAPDPDYPPFEFVTETGVVGVNVDFLNRMSRNLDFQYEVVLYDNWTAVLEGMQRGEVDLLGSVAQTPEREVYMDFIGPYMEVGEVFYIHADRVDITSIEALTGKRVAVVQNYAAAQWLATNHPEMDLVPVAGMLDGLEAVATGDVDAFFENVPVAGYYIRQKGYSNIQILGEPLYYSPANWAVPEGEAELNSIISKGIASIPLGEQTAVFEFWTGYDLGIQREEAATFSPAALIVLLVVASLAVVAGAWSATLRRQVGRQTSELRASRDDLAASKEQLEERVRERTQELHSLYDKEHAFRAALDRQVTEATQTLTALTRDLRNTYHGVLRPRTASLVDAAQSTAWHVAEVVMDSHDDVAKAEGGHAEMPMRRLLEEANETYQQRHARQARIHVADGTIAGDRAWLTRLAYGLVGFTGDRQAVLEVTKSGGAWECAWPGLHMDTEGILEPFHKESGLRLATVARIVRSHGGTVDARSEPAGLVLTLRL